MKKMILAVIYAIKGIAIKPEKIVRLFSGLITICLIACVTARIIVFV